MYSLPETLVLMLDSISEDLTEQKEKDRSKSEGGEA